MKKKINRRWKENPTLNTFVYVCEGLETIRGTNAMQLGVTTDD